jgi:hypothetical protein
MFLNHQRRHIGLTNDLCNFGGLELVLESVLELASESALALE